MAVAALNRGTGHDYEPYHGAPQSGLTARLCAGEPWFAPAYPALEALLGGGAVTGEVFDRGAPFCCGRWDDRARARSYGTPARTTRPPPVEALTLRNSPVLRSPGN